MILLLSMALKILKLEQHTSYYLLMYIHEWREVSIAFIFHFELYFITMVLFVIYLCDLF